MTRVDWSRISLFAELTATEIDVVRPIFSESNVAKGENLVTEDEPGDEMHILIKGRVRVVKAMLIKGMTLPLTEVQDTRKVLATLDSQGYPVFGEMALIDRDTRSATIEVLEDSVFLTTTRDKFFNLVNAHPALGVKLLFVICHRLTGTVRRVNNDLVKLTTALALALSQGGRG